MRTFAVMCMASLAALIGQPALAGEEGLYFGGGLGGYTLDIDDTDFDEDATVVRGFVGYQLGDNLAIEADYQRFNDIEDDILGVESELNGDAWGLSLRPMLPITDMIDLYGKVGYTWYEVDARTEVLGVPLTASESDRAFTYGGGVDVNFGNVSLRGEVSRINVDDADLNLISAGVLVRF